MRQIEGLFPTTEVRGMKSLGAGVAQRLICVWIFLSWSTVSIAFDRLFLFGDSLSDIGNDRLVTRELFDEDLRVPPPALYYRGRFSNGPVWTDFLALHLGINRHKLFPSLAEEVGEPEWQSRIFAYGGSGTFASSKTPASPLLPAFPVRGLLGQVEDFGADLAAAGATADGAALYVVWSGANDYLLAGNAEGIPPPDPMVTVGNILAAIRQLETLGARNFLVPNLPNLANTPLAGLLGPETQGALLSVTQAHNGLLAQGLQELSRSTAAGTTLDLLDVFTLFETIGNNPAAFGFSHGFTELGPASNCLIPLFPESQSCAELPEGLDGNGFPFWDEQHPSEHLHRYIALRAYLCLDDPGSCTVE
jgi:phospholipase/lecithinase/hemolysin